MSLLSCPIGFHLVFLSGQVFKKANEGFLVLVLAPSQTLSTCGGPL